MCVLFENFVMREKSKFLRKIFNFAGNFKLFIRWVTLSSPTKRVNYKQFVNFGSFLPKMDWRIFQNLIVVASDELVLFGSNRWVSALMIFSWGIIGLAT